MADDCRSLEELQQKVLDELVLIRWLLLFITAVIALLLVAALFSAL